jgi:transposase-like protein
MSAVESAPMSAQVHEKPIADALPFYTFDYSGGFNWLLLQTLLLENARLKAEITDLRNRNQELETENQKLYESLHLGCDTSSVPPNKDWKRNAAPKGFDEASEPDTGQAGKENGETPISVTGYLNGDAGEKKRPGGQKNHLPAFMHIDNEREDTVPHYPNKCASCPQLDQCIEEGRFRKYSIAHGYDIEVIRVHKVHILYEATECKNDGSEIHDDFPEVIGTQFYDTNVQLHVLTWHHIFHGSYDRIALAAKELFGLSLSAGTANTIIQRVSAKILGSGFMDALRFFILLFEILLGVDETSACVGGRNAWVHAAVTANVTLLIAHWRRGYEGAVYSGVLQFYTHTLLSDCWAAYFNEKLKCRHAICDGHILRELVAAAYFRNQSWAIEMFDLLLEILAAKNDAVAREENSLPQEYLDDIRVRYRQIVADGYNEIAGVTKGKTFALLERLRKLEDAALAFAVDFSVDFTNNASEQSIRNLKVALRVIGQFKTMSGLADYCIIQSFMDTCRKQGHNPFDMMRILLSGGDIIEAVFGADKAAQLKLMIRLANASANGDTDEINATMAEMPSPLTEELLAAASYGPFKVYNGPPPEKKNSSSAVPKDKMQAARKLNSRKNSRNTAAPPPFLPQNNTDDSLKKNKCRTRAGPLSA